MTSLALPVETRMASFSRLAGMSLTTGKTLAGPVSGVGSSICITPFMTGSSCASAMLYICVFQVSVFNDSFHIGQQGLQLPDDPHHGVGHGLQTQGVAVEQHEAQIFLPRGFDDFVLRLEGLGAKPVQKLREHSKLVQAGGRVHCILGVILNSIRVPQCEDQVGELALLEFGDELLVLLVGKLARVVFKDGLGRLATGRVEQHDRGDIVPV